MTPKSVASWRRHRDGGNGDPGHGVEVVLDHLARVHAVDVVGAEHAHDVRVLVADEVEVLVDRVGRAGEPVRAAAHLGRHRRHVVAEDRREAPGLADVAVEAVALVLGEHDDLEVPGVGEVRQREVDEAVGAAERARPAWPGRSVSGSRRLPSPPARTITRTLGSAAIDVARYVSCRRPVGRWPGAGGAGSRHDQSSRMPRLLERPTAGPGPASRGRPGGARRRGRRRRARPARNPVPAAGWSSASTTVSCSPPTSVTTGSVP